MRERKRDRKTEKEDEREKEKKRKKEREREREKEGGREREKEWGGREWEGGRYVYKQRVELSDRERLREGTRKRAKKERYECNEEHKNSTQRFFTSRFAVTTAARASLFPSFSTRFCFRTASAALTILEPKIQERNIQIFLIYTSFIYRN